jgi:hypothetical protein
MKTSLETPLQRDYVEGPITEVIEKQTIVPTDALLWAAGASILGSLTLRLLGRIHASLFVGQWAPTFLLLAIYSKLAKSIKTEKF